MKTKKTKNCIIHNYSNNELEIEWYLSWWEDEKHKTEMIAKAKISKEEIENLLAKKFIIPSFSSINPENINYYTFKKGIK